MFFWIRLFLVNFGAGVATGVLWMLIARGTAIEFRNRIIDPLWRSFWDFVFSIASNALAFFFGAAFANVFRGVPIDSHDEFSGTFSYALNPYALCVGTLSVVLLALHGTAYVAIRLSESALRKRALKFCKFVVAAIVPLTFGAAIAGLFQRPDVLVNFSRFPILTTVPLLGAAGFVFLIASVIRQNPSGIVTGTTLSFIGLMGSAGVSLYPHLLPAIGSSSGGLTIFNSAVSHEALATALAADLFGIAGVVIFSIYEHRVFHEKIIVADMEVVH